jgi:hypothetical protein
LLDQGVGSDEGIVLACELLNQLLVLVELLQIVRRHGIDTGVLGTIDIMLVTENTIQPSVHCPSRAGDDGETDGSGETLVTLGIIVLEADLEFDGLEEVTLLGLKGVLKQLLDVGTHSGCGEKISTWSNVTRGKWRAWAYHTDCDFRHDDSLPVELLSF